MKIREFIQGEYDIDIYDNISDDWCIAACCPIELTPEGEKEFALALDCEIEHTGLGLWDEEMAVVNIDERKSWIDQKADQFNVHKLFNAAAGYCATTDWNRWFREN